MATETVNVVIGNDVITNAMLANMPALTIKGNRSGAPGDPEDLTANQASTVLDGATDPFARTTVVVAGDAASVATAAADATTKANAAQAAAIAASQPLDSDLTTIAGLTPSNDDIIQRKAGVWTNRTMAQLATDLASGIRSTVLTGLSTASSAAVAATDTILEAFGKLQAFNNLFTTVGLAIARLANPSAVTFLRMNADNTATARTASEMRTDLALSTAAELRSILNVVQTRITSDFTTTSTTLVDVTGGTVAMEANHDYIVEFDILFQTSAATTGIWFSLNGPASPTAVAFSYAIVGSSITNSSQRLGQAAYDQGSTSTDLAAANTTYYTRLGGIIRNGANAGNLQLRVAAETANTVRVMTGTVLRITRTT